MAAGEGTIREFPSDIRFEDTGERRYPKGGEYYIWRHRHNGTLSEVFCHPPQSYDELSDWGVSPDQCAIYRRVL